MAALREALRILARASAPRQGEMNALRMFAGPMAKTADHQALARAQEMAGQGATRDTIWRDTGWFQGVDGKWRFEIDDSGARFNRDAMTPRSYGVGGREIVADTGRLGDTLEHPALYEAYPQLADVTTVQGRGDFNGQFSGSFNSDPSPSIALNLDNLGTDYARRSTTLHEVQHGVQDIEGFARGGNANYVGRAPNPEHAAYTRAQRSDPRLHEYERLSASPEYVAERDASNEAWRAGGYSERIDALEDASTRQNYMSEIKPQIDAVFAEFAALQRERFPTMTRVDELAATLRQDGIPLREPDPLLTRERTYYRLGGEVEARNVQTRQGYTPDQRSGEAPWLSQDVPDDQQIVRFDGDRASNALGDILRASAGLGGVALAGDITLRELLREQRARRTNPAT